MGIKEEIISKLEIILKKMKEKHIPIPRRGRLYV